ncbi:hypothetical protein GCM10008957_23580 [Deinococcus ruber]|uniref:Uncharacterized protein n=1 Tax=Deinococcus ruber TaxID=1848197 RepID=A0A918F592_9DEIO|nr:hypothetical protein GCM10008957_23580 [Deinococcus ruber]
MPAEPVIPDVFASATDNSSATGGDPSGSTVPVTQGRSSSALPIPVPVATPAPTPIRTVPAAPLVQAVPVAPAVPLSLQSLPSSPVPQPTTVPGTVPTVAAALPAPVPVQLTPLPAPISASPTRPVTLVPATVPAAPAVTLMAVAQGETPTAMLNTPTGQLMVGIGDPVTLNNTSYTVQTIHATSIQLKSSHDTLTLKE